MTTVKHRISSYETLPDGYIKPSAVLKIMQDAASEDSANLGADYDTLRKDDVIFVVTKMVVRYVRQPRVDECLCVRTWNSGTSGVSFVRNYCLSVDGEVVGTAVSRWVLVSYSERRIQRPDLLAERVTTNPTETLELEPSRRIALSNAEPQISRYTAVLTDMDTNYHVNNTRYGDMLIDYSGADFSRFSVKEFEIHYSKEMKAGECAEIKATADGTDIAMTAACNGAQIFAARLELEAKNS